MLSYNKYLESTDKMGVFDIPYIFERDTSITKLDNVTIYDSNHGTGSLANTNDFSFETNNEDMLFIPADSYLLATVKLQKADGTPYANADAVTIDTNAFNIFSEARYYVDDQELERQDHLGISTMLYNLTKYTFTEFNSCRETQLLALDKEFNKKYMVESNHEIELLLPLRKAFPFFHQVQHAFRGIKHRITLTKNDNEKVVLRWASGENNATPAPAAGRFVIEKLVWKIPYVEPSLPMQAKLENLLAKNSTFNMSYQATSVFKITPPRNSEIRIPLSCTLHKPTINHVFIAFQNQNRSNNQESTYMNFDNLNLEYINVEVNSVKFPDKDIICHFNAPYKVTETYNNFLRACTDGLSYEESYRNFINIFPIHHIDVSHHKENLYENSSFPNIVINAKFRVDPPNIFNMFVVIYNIREVQLNLDNKKMKIIK